MKRWQTSIAAGLAVVLIAAAAVYGGPAVSKVLREGTALAAEGSAVSASSAAAEAQRTITVSGTGTISVDPDVAYVHFGVVTKAASAKAAQAENAKAFAAIEKVLKDEFGIPAEDVKTSGFSVHPEYQWVESRKKSEIVGYTASHSVTVTYRDMEGLGRLLDAVSQAGANQINGIRFGTEKSEMYELQALEKAMENARAKAEALAKAAGAPIKRVLHVSESGSLGGVPPVVPYAKAAVEMAASDAGTSVQPGQLEYTVKVSVVYEL